MTTLRTLTSNDKTTDNGLKNLPPLTQLEYFAIGDNNHITDAGLGYVGQIVATDRLGPRQRPRDRRRPDEPSALTGSSTSTFAASRCPTWGWQDSRTRSSRLPPHITATGFPCAGFAALPGKDGMNDLIVCGSGVTDEGLKNSREFGALAN